MNDQRRQLLRGADMRWLPWMRGYGRCPYCTGLPAGDWLAICDCWLAERTLPQSAIAAPFPTDVLEQLPEILELEPPAPGRDR